MITFECSWCDAELAIDGLDATSVDCADCGIRVEIAPDPEPIALAA